jgi:hypothetical protein
MKKASLIYIFTYNIKNQSCTYKNTMEKKILEFAASASPAFILQHDELSPHICSAR